METTLSQKKVLLDKVELLEIRNTADQNTLNQSAEEFKASNFRLTNEIEEEEKEFARATTKFAIDAAKAETEKAMHRAAMIETLCTVLNDRVSRYVACTIVR